LPVIVINFPLPTRIGSKLKKPPKSAGEYLATLEQQGLPQTCQILHKAIDLI